MTLNDIRFRSYGKYASSNYGAHCLEFTVGNRSYYFSYDTLVAVFIPGKGIQCIQNYWSTTTGKHLNWIEPDHKKRLDAKSFDRLIESLWRG